MARMRVNSLGGRYLVTMTGQLSGRDLRRLEQLCGPALEQKDIPLTVCLDRTTSVDQSARAYLDRLMQRGAVVRFE